MNINELKRQKAAKLDEAKRITDELDAPDCDLTDEQRETRSTKADKLVAESESLNTKIADAEETGRQSAERARRIEALSGGDDNRRAVTEQPNNSGLPRVEASEPNWEKDPMRGFARPRDFFTAVVNATLRPSATDERLKYLDAGKYKAAVGSDEQSGASDPYGGFFVPEGMSPDLLMVAADANPLLALATRLPMDSPVVKINSRVDKNHSTSVSGGFTVSRRSETGGFNSSRMETEQITLTANTLGGLAYATQELLDDSPRSVAALIEAGFRDEFASQSYLDMLTGTGVGEPEGVKDSAATVAVAKEGSQAADTINGTNLLKMRQRAYRFGNSVWVANHDTYLQLSTAHSTLTNDDRPLFSHGNGTDVPDTLLGRPIFFTEFAETVGDKGDIYLLDMSQYLYGVYQPLQTGESIHVRFSNHEQAFKFTMRDAGAPWWRSALTPKKGANTLSPFVTLAARA